MYIGSKHGATFGKTKNAARGLYKFAFIFNTFPVVITYIVAVNFLDELNITPNIVITYFSRIAIHMVYISFGLKAFIKKQSKIVDAFVLSSAIFSTLTVILYYWLMYSLMSFGDGLLGRAAFIQDILVHFMMPLTLLAIIFFEIWKGKRYSWTAIVPIVPFYVAYHYFMVWYSPRINNYWPYWFLDPRKIGWDELYRRYVIVVSVSTIAAILIVAISKIRNKKYDFKMRRK